jgi:formamidopyrimidine-DNA glycosylase
MPELPEVETVRAIVARELPGRVITGVTFHDFPGVVGDMSPNVFAAMVTGRILGEPERRGKYLVLPLDDGTALVVHLRMTGRLLVVPSDAAPARFEHLAIHLDGGRDLRFADQRKFGRVVHMPADDVRRQLSGALGPEPLERRFTSEYLLDRLRGRTAPVKAFLLDQRNVAGLGNIYVDEALFLSRIHPLTPAGSLSETQARALVRAIRGVLRSAITNQGTTFSTFENPYGERGGNAAFLKVYGRARAGEPCVRCGTPLAWMRLGGRGTSYCPHCQPLPSRDETVG